MKRYDFQLFRTNADLNDFLNIYRPKVFSICEGDTCMKVWYKKRIIRDFIFSRGHFR